MHTVSSPKTANDACESAEPSPRPQHNDSGQDDSDYEDNITVTVPPPHTQGNIYRDRQLNGRHGRHHRHNTDLGTPPRNAPHLVSRKKFI